MVGIRFVWFGGLALEQAQRCVEALHDAAKERGIWPILEISSKSPIEAGRQLSALRLELMLPDGRLASVETAYQASKVFVKTGGPWPEVYSQSGWEAKKFSRSHSDERISYFDFFGESWPLTPPSAFYDWLYINALMFEEQNSQVLEAYAAFSDIAFNPRRSFACQARSAAIFRTLRQRGVQLSSIKAKDSFLKALGDPRGGISRVQSDAQQLLF